MNIITDKKKALNLLKKSINGHVINNFSKELRNDFDIIMEGVNLNGNSLFFASPELANHKEIVAAAMKKNLSSFIYAGNEIKKDSQFILDNTPRYQEAARIFKLCDPSLQLDRDFVMAFLKKNPFTVKFLPPHFKKDKELILIVLNTTYCFNLVHKKFRDDFNIAKKAMAKPYNFVHLSSSLKNNPEIALEAMSHIEHNAEFSDFDSIGEDLKKSKDFFEKVILIQPWLFQHASKELKEDFQLVESAIKKIEPSIDYSYSNLDELLTPLVKKNSEYLKLSPYGIINNKKIILEAIQKSHHYINYASEEIKNIVGVDQRQHISTLMRVIKIEEFSEKLEKDLKSHPLKISKIKL